MKLRPAVFKLGLTPEVAHEARSCITAVYYLAELFRNEGTLSKLEYEMVQTAMSVLLQQVEKARDNT